MFSLEKSYFYNLSLGRISFKKVIETIFDYMAEKPDRFYDIVVGCDSSSGEKPAFPVAIVILRVGQGGRFFFKRIQYSKEKKFYNLHQRVLQEILISCELALFLKEKLKERVDELRSSSRRRDGRKNLFLRPSPPLANARVIEKPGHRLNYQFRYIHADIGENGKTKDMIKEVVGLIRSNGFEAKVKPESFAASVVADRFT
ncbi:hypothetical protein CO121_01205 [bacterium (Candidatus Gribaldobacteria) CG_4_9_14_3_um_filter_36_15]|uniref:DUF458 domain-containing protein n=4 Tax=Candidatus Gribaldobacteria TaxID=2798536 RepID=A0A2M7VKB1_9BACT|nr:MAG: hypothetical protein AUK07_01125 [Parcubacteria group bacterium CG2_30_36_21]PIR91415.1 MAG: hypothetical protein COU02_00370 [bacterium (Candidatus Gribaldobacteria) CG10_big_fil_rev_8_21_14_0_10_37_46]PIV14163.1 MAG: hypothetical protein COS44_00435 [bacterium (Candidatus Gribaldobacteria) CG03_land_8_20_14_0_80_36_40]PJA02277.1 MAG: hypothetical protein COX73_01620 [bacterium (Candidatus Gribaldobacteria) CG_4_10_14_0_2_um_filter_36_18]PJB09190.1 MAG: hypothetical protein CO121_01205